MGDDAYDALFGESSTVGSETGDTPHLYPMWSLQKHYAEDGKPPLDAEDLVETPKLDGCAVSLRYIHHRLTLALTRGNGKLGQVVTDRLSDVLVRTTRELRYIVPAIIEDPSEEVQITGELVALACIENSRNFVAGYLNTKDPEEAKQKATEGQIIFVAYGIQRSNDITGRFDTYIEDMKWLADVNNFNTVLEDKYEDYPKDGTVYRVNNNKKFKELGYTSKHPRGAYAFKEKQKPVVTKLLDVIWQTGKSGKVTPIAILEPVVIEEATVSRATLNNMAFIDGLGLEIGCNVEIIRAGMIIPQIVGRAD